MAREQQLFNMVRQLRQLYRLLYYTRPTECSGSSTSLSRAQQELVAVLARQPEGMAAGVLAASLGVSNGAVTQLVDSLAEKGVVTRRAHPDDRRSIMVILTQPSPGAQDFETAYAVHIGPLFDDLSDRELDELLGLIQRIKITKEA